MMVRPVGRDAGDSSEPDAEKGEMETGMDRVVAIKTESTPPTIAPIRLLRHFGRIAEFQHWCDGALHARAAMSSLASFDETSKPAVCCTFMAINGFDQIGIRRSGRTVGYVTRESLAESSEKLEVVPFNQDDLVSESVSIALVVDRLASRPFIFVAFQGDVIGIVTRADLQKPVLRLWLFGLLTHLEVSANELLLARLSDDEFERRLPPNDLKVAQRFHRERRANNEHVSLVYCAGLAPKLRMCFDLVQDAGIREKDPESVIREIKTLRDNLAHSMPFKPNNIAVAASLLIDAIHLVTTCHEKETGDEIPQPHITTGDLDLGAVGARRR